MCPCGFCMQSRVLVVVGWNIFLCMALGLVFSSDLYFVMVILQFMEVCLVIILWAVILAVFPMFAKSLIHVCKSLWLMGSGGICWV